MKLHKMMLFLLLSLVLVLSLAPLSCIVIDDHNDDDELERINYINNTPFTVDNYIDERYRGSVDPYGTYTVYGDFEGRHKFYSKAVESNLEWGPSYFTLSDGQNFDIYLDPPSN